MPCWRQSAAVAIPASCSLSTPTICSCVNRLPRIPSSLGHMPIEDSHYPWTSFRGAGHQDKGKVALVLRVSIRPWIPCFSERDCQLELSFLGQSSRNSPPCSD